jgi:hypothetical protein
MGDQMKKHGILALMLAAACYAPFNAHAAVTCSLASLSGTYNMTVSGSYASVVRGALGNQFSASGQIIADGAGKLTGTMTLSANGQIVRCAGTARLNFTAGGGFPFDIFLTGTGFNGVDTDDNTNLTASATQ